MLAYCQQKEAAVLKLMPGKDPIICFSNKSDIADKFSKKHKWEKIEES